MHPTPNTRPRHALHWVLGVGLAFVVVVAMALQVARRRADDQWEMVLAHWEKEWQDCEIWQRFGPAHQWIELDSAPDITPSDLGGFSLPGPSGGGMFSGWRQYTDSPIWFNLHLRQEWHYFGSQIEARMNLTSFPGPPADLVSVVHAILADVDVELVVEP